MFPSGTPGNFGFENLMLKSGVSRQKLGSSLPVSSPRLTAKHPAVLRAEGLKQKKAWRPSERPAIEQRGQCSE